MWENTISYPYDSVPNSKKVPRMEESRMNVTFHVISLDMSKLLDEKYFRLFNKNDILSLKKDNIALKAEIEYPRALHFRERYILSQCPESMRWKFPTIKII